LRVTAGPAVALPPAARGMRCRGLGGSFLALPGL